MRFFVGIFNQDVQSLPVFDFGTVAACQSKRPLSSASGRPELSLLQEWEGMVPHFSSVSCKHSDGSSSKYLTGARIFLQLLILRTAARCQPNCPILSHFLIAGKEPTPGHFGEQRRRRCVVRELSYGKRLSQSWHRNLNSMASTSPSGCRLKILRFVHVQPEVLLCCDDQSGFFLVTCRYNG